MDNLVSKSLCFIVGLFAIFFIRGQYDRIENLCDTNQSKLREILDTFDYWANSKPELSFESQQEMERSRKSINDAGEKMAKGEITDGIAGLIKAETDYVGRGGPFREAKENAQAMSRVRFWPLDAISSANWTAWVVKNSIFVAWVWVLIVTVVFVFFVSGSSGWEAVEVMGSLGLVLALIFGSLLGLVYVGTGGVPNQLIAIPLGTLVCSILFCGVVLLQYGILQLDK